MEDSQIIELYWKKDGEAIRISEETYGGYCLTVANNILHNPEDAEECVNDTWLHAWNAIPPQRPKRLKYFLARITRNLALDRWHALTAEKRGGCGIEPVLEELAECADPSSSLENELIAKELSDAIRKFVRTLPEREGNLFIRRYFFTEPVRQIAERYGLTGNHVMVLLSRTRKKLKAYLTKEGFLNG